MALLKRKPDPETTIPAPALLSASDLSAEVSRTDQLIKAKMNQGDGLKAAINGALFDPAGPAELEVRAMRRDVAKLDDEIGALQIARENLWREFTAARDREQKAERQAQVAPTVSALEAAIASMEKAADEIGAGSRTYREARRRLVALAEGGASTPDLSALLHRHDVVARRLLNGSWSW